jgi:hypothetical protein
LPYRYPVLQAGPIENNGSYKGGTYSEGTFYTFFVKAAQYGVVKITDNGSDSICVTLEGYKKDLGNGSTSKLVTYSFCRKIGGVQTSVAELEKNSFELFPNPSSGIFNFRFKERENAVIEIYSIDGKFINRSMVMDNNYHSVDLTGQTLGIYTAKIVTANGVSTKRIVLK